MKTKHQICSEADIPMTTLNYWINQQVFPSPTGINKQQATWDDSIMDAVAFIRESQAAGMKLPAIKDAMPKHIRSTTDRERELIKALRQIEEVAQNAADDPMGPWSVFAWIINRANDAIEVN